jgi:hypothetical protein
MSVKSKNTPGGSDGSQPIGSAAIGSLIRNYKLGTTPDLDTKYAWFGVNALNALISHNNANGIRIYYGRHDDNHPSYAGRHTVVLVATVDSDNPEAPCSESSVDQLDPSKNPKPEKNLTFFGMGLDEGALCPPRCPSQPPPPPPVGQ